MLNRIAARVSVRTEDGATATEYALLVTFIALAIILGVSTFGSSLSAFFTRLGARVGTFS
jgi:pilus assembly protein Flp/PilA